MKNVLQQCSLAVMVLLVVITNEQLFAQPVKNNSNSIVGVKPPATADFNNAVRIHFANNKKPYQLITGLDSINVVSFKIGETSFSTEAVMRSSPDRKLCLCVLQLDNGNFFPVQLSSGTLTKNDYSKEIPFETFKQSTEAELATQKQAAAQRAEYAKAMRKLDSTLALQGGHGSPDDFDKTFTKVEEEAMFSLHICDWQRFLSNLNTDIAKQKGAPAGTGGTVVLQFIVHTDGKVTDVEAISGPPDYGMREEAVRLMRTSPNWQIPPRQNGRNVNAYTKIAVTFPQVK